VKFRGKEGIKSEINSTWMLRILVGTWTWIFCQLRRCWLHT